MIIAELHGKIPSKLTDKEDLLTSNVFSFFKYSNREIFRDYLNLLGIEVTLNESHKAEFHFWPCYDDGTEPDLVVICGSYYLLFEAKLYADFSPKTSTIDAQIDREIKMGGLAAKNLDKTFVYIAITAEYSKNKEKYFWYENNEYRFIWTNWQLVASFVFSILNDNHLHREIEFISDLYSLLVKKRLRCFSGITKLKYDYSFQTFNPVFYDTKTSKFKGEFSGFVEVLSKHGQVSRFTSNYKKSFFNSLSKVSLSNTPTLFYGNKYG